MIKETRTAKFLGKRTYDLISLKGIGNAAVYSTLQIIAEVVIGDYRLEILFHVIANLYLKYDVMISPQITLVFKRVKSC